MRRLRRSHIFASGLAAFAFLAASTLSITGLAQTSGNGTQKSGGLGFQHELYFN